MNILELYDLYIKYDANADWAPEEDYHDRQQSFQRLAKESKSGLEFAQNLAARYYGGNIDTGPMDRYVIRWEGPHQFSVAYKNMPPHKWIKLAPK